MYLGSDNKVCIWNVGTGECLLNFMLPGSPFFPFFLNGVFTKNEKVGLILIKVGFDFTSIRCVYMKKNCSKRLISKSVKPMVNSPEDEFKEFKPYSVNSASVKKINVSNHTPWS